MWSGAGKAIVRLAQELKSRGHRLHVVSSGQSKGLADWPSYVDRLVKERIPYSRIDFFDRSPEVFWPSVERFERLVRVFDPDVIHAHSGVAAFGAIAASKAPILATLHSWNPDRPQWMNTMDLWALNRCDRVMCVSSSYRDYLLEQGLRKDTSESVYLGIDGHEIREQSSLPVENPLASRKYFCYLGRLETRKRQLLLVETLAKLPDDWSLMLIGEEGEPGYAASLREKAEELKVSRRLLCTGHVENPYPLMREATCFVSASVDEGLGLSVLEAMALGVPVVATPARGIVDFIQSEHTGLLAPADPFELAARIRTLETQRGFAGMLMSEAASVIHTTFSWPRAVDHYERRFEALAQSHLVNVEAES